MKLRTFLEQIAADPKLLREFQRDPEGVAKRKRLTVIAQRDLLSGSKQRVARRIEIEERLSKSQRGAFGWVINPLEPLRGGRPLKPKPKKKPAKRKAKPKSRAKR